LEYSMALVHEQTRDRVATHFAIKDPRKFAEAVLAELLPLDDQRRTEMAVNMAVVAESPSHPALRPGALDGHQAVSDACASVLSRLQRENVIRPEAEMAYETQRLHALVDGLALHALTAERKDLRPKVILTVLRRHLAELAPG